MSKQNDQIAELLTDDSFLRWIHGEASTFERKKWDRWVREDPARRAIVSQAKELSQSLQFTEEQPDTPKELKKLENALQHKGRSSRKIKRTGMVARRWIRVAAVITLFLTVIGIARYANWEKEQEQKVKRPVITTIETDYGEVRRLHFSDGSKIILNADSKLTYPKTHGGGDMEVTLEGEAYFKITHKTGPQQRTFSVRTPEGKVAVLGTRFNVNTHVKKTEVVLEEGRVQVEQIDAGGATKNTYSMRPGERALFTANKGNIEVQEVDTELYTSWTSFELKFENTPLSQIADRLKEIYGVDVEFTNTELKEIEFSGSAPNKNFTVLLGGLRTLLDIPIVHKGNTITFGGP